ncbi:hypothetical protein EVAR_56230_1 [Eumeta japonica]|uniref:Uncharacterized protein n=1 Tax=Eumeta variegata TaxID=151549 RepID=A0A4C1XIC1_EUMVA|nr:hypothetical protein EVAR_56230_1 [Eumeta japonica]
MVTPLCLRVSITGDDHLLSDGSPASPPADTGHLGLYRLNAMSTAEREADAGGGRSKARTGLKASTETGQGRALLNERRTKERVLRLSLANI